MSETPRVCMRCGAPSVVRRGGLGQGQDQILDLCDTCAAVESAGWGMNGSRPGQVPHKVELGIILAAVGAFVIFISALADWLHFGQSPGLGWKQGVGIGLAAFMVMLGAMFRTLFLVILGLSIGGLSVLADRLGFGSGAGFGYQQIAGVIVGAAAITIGLSLARPGQSEP